MECARLKVLYRTLTGHFSPTCNVPYQIYRNLNPEPVFCNLGTDQMWAPQLESHPECKFFFFFNIQTLRNIVYLYTAQGRGITLVTIPRKMYDLIINLLKVPRKPEEYHSHTHTPWKWESCSLLLCLFTQKEYISLCSVVLIPIVWCECRHGDKMHMYSLTDWASVNL